METKFDALFTSDWHLTSSAPLSRKDDYLATLKGKVSFVLETAVRHNVPVFIAGDIGDQPLWRGKLFAEVMTLLNVLQTKPKIYAIAGQHDLLYHNLDKYKDSALWVLHCAGFLKLLRRPMEFENFVIHPFHYGTYITGEENFLDRKKKKRVALIHRLVCKNKTPQTVAMGAFYSHELLVSNPWYDLIVSGDNHRPFLDQLSDRDKPEKAHLFLNCGALVRKDVSLENHAPLIYLWSAKENLIHPVIVPFASDVWSQDAHEFFDEKSEVSLFVKKLAPAGEFSLNFEKSLLRFIQRNVGNMSKAVKDKLMHLIQKNDVYQ